MAATAACFVPPDVGYAVDEAGDLYRTSDGARSWRVVEQAPKPPVQYVGPWAYLSCSGDDIALGLEAFCMAACAAFPNSYLVDYSEDGGRTWAGRSGGWFSSSVARFGPGPHLPYGGLGTVAINSRGRLSFRTCLALTATAPTTRPMASGSGCGAPRGTRTWPPR